MAASQEKAAIASWVYLQKMGLFPGYQHYNHIQLTYRNFSLTWILATFFGIGYCLTSFEVNLPFNPLIVIGILCLASLSGIVLIYYMDLIVTERSIAVIVHESQTLEKQNSWLPQVIHTSAELNKLIGYISRKRHYYIGCFFIIYSTLSASILSYVYIFKFSVLVFFTSLLTLIILLMLLYFFLFSSKRVDPYKQIDNSRN